MLGNNVGQIVCGRARAVDELFERESEAHTSTLKGIVPEQGSSSESWQLRQLRATHARHLADTTRSEGSSNGARHATVEHGRDGYPVETELYWNDGRVVWSRGGVAIRTFTFDEKVQTACWAWFEVDGMWEEDEDGGRNKIRTARRDRQAKAQRALCIFLQSSMIVHLPHTGREYVKRLDFSIATVHPLDVGVIVQRGLEHEDIRRRRTDGDVNFTDSFVDPPLSDAEELDRSAIDQPLPNLFYLRRPLDEFKAVESFDKLSLAQDGTIVCSPASRPAQLFDRVNEEVVHVGQGSLKDGGDLAILITADHLAKRIRIYQVIHGANAPNIRASIPALDGKEKSRRPTLRKRTTSGRISSHTARNTMGTVERARISSAPGFGVSTVANAPLDGAGGVDSPPTAKEEDDVQDAMQLLDDLDEVAEHEDALDGKSSNPRPSQGARRRISRSRSQQSTSAASTRTPFRPSLFTAVEERKGPPRLRTSSAHFNQNGGTTATPSSAAARLTRNDDQSMQTRAAQERPDLLRRRSGMAAYAQADSDLPFGKLTDVLDAEHPGAFFENVAYGFAAVCLLEETDMPADLNGKGTSTSVVVADKDMVTVIVRGDSQVYLRRRYAWQDIGSTHGLLRLVSQHSEAGGDDTNDVRTEGGIGFHSRDPLVDDVVRALDHDDSFRQAWRKAVDPSLTSVFPDWQVLVSLVLQRRSRSEASESTHGTSWEKLLQDEVPLSDALLPGLETSIETGSDQDWRSSETRSARDGEKLKIDLLALQYLAQEVRLDKMRVDKDLSRLGAVITELCAEAGWLGWIDYWTRLVGDTLPSRAPHIASNTSNIPELPIFDVYDHLLRILQGFETGSIDKAKCPTIHRLEALYRLYTKTPVQDIYTTLKGSRVTAEEARAHSVLEALFHGGNSQRFLAKLPLTVALPIRRSMKACKMNPPTSWPAKLYLLVGRPDVAKLCSRLEESSKRGNANDEKDSAFPRHIGDRLHDLPHLPDTCYELFAKDYRLADVNNILQTSRAVAVKGPSDAGSTNADEELVAEQQKRVFVSASDRIKATSIGRGMFLFRSQSIKVADQLDIPPVCLRIRMLSHCIVQHREPDAEGVEMEWPEFHNGASAALKLAFGESNVESGWIYSQTAGEFSARNAGFIFGMGLSGQLRNLGKIHAHHYLSNRHALTSIGLLLGIAVSFVGSCDAMAKALMSIHLVHTLPAYSKPLKTTMLEQSAALVGLGLCFLGSNDRWASRMALKAMGTDLVLTDDSQMARRECFSLSAGFALGLVCLAKGREQRACVVLERDIVPSIERLIKRFKGGSASANNRNGRKGKDNGFEWQPEIGLTTTPATLALALIYLRSNRADAAAKLPCPESAAELDEIRPDLLLVRTICRAMIMWDQIEASESWLDGNLPEYLRVYSKQTIVDADQTTQLAYWSIRTGAIFALGLRFAGSNDAAVRAILLDEHQSFQGIADQRATSYFGKVRQHALRCAVDTVHSCLAMVYAGSGDVEILRLIRRWHYKVDTFRYGNYMASSMSIGLLFLGGGRLSLSSSDKAIAALLLSFFPRFPVNAQDNRAHLQAYRHLWVLAVEARLLSVKDVERNGSAVKVPIVTASRKGPDGTAVVLAGKIGQTPCVLPKLDTLGRIAVVTDRFFPLTLDLEGNDRLAKRLMSAQTLFVLRKKGMLSHDLDPSGHASLLSRTQHLLSLSELLTSATRRNGSEKQRKDTTVREIGQLVELLESSTDRPEIVSLVRSLVSTHLSFLPPEEAVWQKHLLQCLVLNNRDEEMGDLEAVISLFVATRKILAHRRNAGSVQERARLATDLRFAHRCLTTIDDDDGGHMRNYVKQLIEAVDRRISQRLHDEPALVEAVHQYARQFSSGPSFTPSQRLASCRSALEVLTVVDVPSFTVLDHLSSAVRRALSQGQATPQSAHAFLRSILKASDVSLSPLVLKHFDHIWSQ